MLAENQNAERLVCGSRHSLDIVGDRVRILSMDPKILKRATPFAVQA
jgi:hypothetical protein